MAKATTTQILTTIKEWVLGRIAEIAAVIPSQASSTNQLADKAFVNSSIATATATFRGTYNLVSDLSLTTSATQQQIAAALATKMAALSIMPDANDYAFVQIPAAVLTPTVIARVDRYKFNGSAWAYEYSLNNSGFTAEQWAAINSGITAESWDVTPEFVDEDPSETELFDQYAALLQQLHQGIIDAQNAKADYVGDDNYVYRWNAVAGEYQRTNLYVKGDPGVTDYTQLDNTPTKLSDFTDDLGSSPAHTHQQYALDADLKAVAKSGSYNDLTNKPDFSPYTLFNVLGFSEFDPAESYSMEYRGLDGDVVFKDSKLWMFIANHTAGDPWDDEEVREFGIKELLDYISTKLTTKADTVDEDGYTLIREGYTLEKINGGLQFNYGEKYHVRITGNDIVVQYQSDIPERSYEYSVLSLLQANTPEMVEDNSDTWPF